MERFGHEILQKPVLHDAFKLINLLSDLNRQMVQVNMAAQDLKSQILEDSRYQKSGPSLPSVPFCGPHTSKNLLAL